MNFFSKKFKFIAIIVCIGILLSLTPNVNARPWWKKVLENTAKVVAGSAIVRGLSKELNNFINTIFINNHIENKNQTKVVPILTLSSSRGTIGAAQVSGPEYKLKEVRSVLMLEEDFQGKYRIKMYVPCNSSNPFKGPKRVYGVGVTAVMDIKI